MRLASPSFLPVLLAATFLACGGGSDDGVEGEPGAGGTSGSAGSGTAGNGKAGSGTAGTGTAGSGTAGTGTAGTGTAGTGTAGSGTAGTGTAGTGTAGTGTAGSGTAGTGTAGTGTAGTGTAGTGTAGSGTAGTGTAGTGTAGGGGIFSAPQKPLTFTYRIAKPYTPSEVSKFDVLGLDLFDNDAATVKAQKAMGHTVICYFSSTYEDWRPDFMGLSSGDQAALDAVLAGPLDTWPGEQWVDLHGFSATSAGAGHTFLRKVMSGRIQQAKSKGCDAVDFDNVNEHENGVTNKQGQKITSADQYAYNAWLAGEAHAAGMKAFLKNDLTQIADSPSFPGGKGLAQVFDGAINEQCFEFTECAEMTPFRDLGKPIFVIQYDYGTTFPSAAQKTEANQLHLNVSYYKLNSFDALKGDPDATYGTW